MTGSQPLQYIWWLVSRASGVVAMLLVTLAVLMGLAMSARALPRAGLKRAVARLHEHVALTALGAIGLHGAALLGDRWLAPGLAGIAIPFHTSYRPGLTGIGILAGYLAVLVGPTFYLRRRLGARRWRRLHRLSVLVWGMSAVHALGAGSDAGRLWLRSIVLVPVAPLGYLLALRLLGATAGYGEALSVKPHRARAPIETALASSEVSTIPGSSGASAKKLRVAGMSRART